MIPLNALAHVCPLLTELVKFEDEFTDESIYDTIQVLAPFQSDLMFLSLWQGIFDRFEKLFYPVLTDEGLCFSLNTLNSQDMYTNK